MGISKNSFWRRIEGEVVKGKVFRDALIFKYRKVCAKD